MTRTELICPEIWGSRVQITQLPSMFEDDKIYLDFTIQDVASIKGNFIVEEVLHILDGKGYTQRLLLRPETS